MHPRGSGAFGDDLGAHGKVGESMGLSQSTRNYKSQGILAFMGRCKKSMRTVGDCYDDAVCKSFFATLSAVFCGGRSLWIKGELDGKFPQFIEADPIDVEDIRAKLSLPAEIRKEETFEILCIMYHRRGEANT